MRIVFWGTPEFAAPTLRALLGEGFDVVGVVTQPDKPHGRSREIVPSPVKQIAIEEELTLFQPKNAKDPELYQALSGLKADISVVVAYGHILPMKIIDLPEMGTLNVHASLLPALRGAAPIQAAIQQGDTETGVTVMRVVPALDAGPMILQATVLLIASAFLDEENLTDEPAVGHDLVALLQAAHQLVVLLALVGLRPNENEIEDREDRPIHENGAEDWIAWHLEKIGSMRDQTARGAALR